jgi:sortase (surface protein transpeptidase)
MSRFAPGVSALFFALAAILISGVSVHTDAGPPSPAASRSVPPTAIATVAASPSATPLPPIPLGYRIQMPRLSIDLAILEGDVERDVVQLKTPENFAFHLPGTGVPGSGMNSYIYAHARIGMFINLWNARVGDEVFISTPDGRVMRYLVSEVHPRVPPDEVQWVAPTPPDRLTLQTSTGPNPSDARFIVVALPG